MKVSKAEKKLILDSYVDLNKSGSFTSGSNLRRSLGLKHIPIEDFENVLSENLDYVEHRRAVKRFLRRKVVVAGVCL